MCVSESKFNI